MTHSSIHSLVLTAVQNVAADRLQNAVCGLADGSMIVTLTRQSDVEIWALVKNGDGKEYGVTLTESLSTCSCKDALYRGTVCKHAVAVALHVLHTLPSQKAAPAPQFPTFHLMWCDGLVLCGEHHPERVQVWPWTQGMLGWPEVCPACVTAYQHPKPAIARAA